MTRRAYLTAKEKLAVVIRQGWRCIMCRYRFGEHSKVEFDHWIPVAMGNGGKPDSAMCKSCHARKTKRDVAAIAKVKRLMRKNDPSMRKEVRAKRKIASRGFDRRYRRKMSGALERVAA